VFALWLLPALALLWAVSAWLAHRRRQQQLAIVLIVINLLVRIATARRVGALLGSFRQIGPLLATGEALAFLDTPDVQPITGALRTELPALRSLRAVARWAGRDPLAADPLAAMLLEYLNLLFLVDLNALYFGTRELQARGGALRRVIAATGDIDSAIAVASFRAGARHWTRPRFRNSTATPATNGTAPTATIAATSIAATMTDICHPLIDAAVPNSIALGPPHGVLVTGSNMSGKTTFLRTVGVTMILAQTINTRLATEYDAPVFAVRSCIGRTDDLVAGKSYYLVEVEAVLALVRASAGDTPHLFLLDELFRGTNAVERVAAAEAVLIELLVPSRHADAHAGATATAAARQLRPHAVLVSTHDDGLADLVGDLYVPCHFAETVGDEGLVFDHRLRPGPATTRNAIALLRLHGAPDSLVSRALARAAHLDPSYSLDR
jgi:DNA mismatch repair ATPase MutS